MKDILYIYGKNDHIIQYMVIYIYVYICMCSDLEANSGTFGASAWTVFRAHAGSSWRPRGPFRSPALGIAWRRRAARCSSGASPKTRRGEKRFTLKHFASLKALLVCNRRAKYLDDFYALELPSHSWSLALKRETKDRHIAYLGLYL